MHHLLRSRSTSCSVFRCGAAQYKPYAPIQPCCLHLNAVSSAFPPTILSSITLLYVSAIYVYFRLNMDPLSVTASIIAILQLSSKVVGYLTDVKDASKERAKCALEASNLHSLFLNLRLHLEGGSVDMPWYTAVGALAVENGPLDQFKQALETLQATMTDGGRLKNAKDMLVRRFKKEELAGILGRIERLKTLVEIALQIDHL
jgi:hypothetical protein